MQDGFDPDLHVDVRRVRGATVIAVAGELDAASTARLAAPLAEAAAAGDGVVLDLAACEFLDSTGLHAIIDARAATRDRGAGFVLRCVPGGPVARVIEVALPGMIELHDSLDTALEAVRG